ncbi:MAG TPA: polyprenyl synthetase family protein [bacterium]|nr:polyprenyl synthetase family protein [bacterium]HPS30111.1 polyprenyl synthetase family protein [bacterium]
MTLLEEKQKIETEYIEKKLFFYLDSLQIPAILNDAMKYSLSAGGKRVRPFLAVAVSQLLGKDKELVMPYAAALEFIHTYSLIHDDLPALDNDDLRRGRPSSHKAFGEDLAILAGDALNADAFSIIFEFGHGNFKKGGKYFSRAVGGRGMVLGQVKDCRIPEDKRNIEVLNDINLFKTGALIMASTAGAAAWLDADEYSISALENYGLNLGLAFQIADDILDITSSTEELGKKVGSDAALNKKTYPFLLGIEKAGEKALEHSQRAKSALDFFEDSEWKQVLTELADFVIRRRK